MTKEKPVKIVDIERFEPEIEKGLSPEQVELRRSQKLVNIVKDKYSKTYLNIFATNIFTYFNLICIAVAICLIFVKALADALFMVIISSNILIGIYQEIRAKITIEKLKLLNEPCANVVRNGEYKDISIKEVVLDDIIVFSAGKQICTDCIIKSGHVEVNESLLTGESDLISKTVGDILYSGSFIVAGSCYAKADQVGKDNYISILASKAKKYKKPNSQIMKTLRNMIAVIGVLIPILAAMVFFANRNTFGDNRVELITRTAGAIIGLIPAGLFLLSSVALFVGAVRLAKNKCLVQNIYCIEMLARVNVLCLDKTGTITDGKMSVKDFVILENKTDLDLEEVLGNMLCALTDNNHTSIALKERFKLRDTFVPLNVFPFSSVKKMSAVSFENIGTFTIGAPEFILSKIPQALKTKINNYAKDGYRVLVLGHCAKNIVDGDITKNMKPLALIVLSDNVRPDAIETINWFNENNVDIKVISGDNPITVSEVARRAGINNADKFISLEKLSNAEVVEAATQYTIFGRVSPSQKALLIKTLKLSGKTVAMTGDGVNDILAMKESDCAVSIASGSEAARNVSHLVLMNSDFSPMPKVVAEGRKVVNNLQRSSSLYLMKTLFIAMLCVLVFCAGTYYPFTPKYMFPLEMWVIGFSSLILALENNDQLITGNFLKNIIGNAVPAATTMILNIGALLILKKFFSFNFEIIAILCITLVGVLYLVKLCRPYTRRRLLLVIFVVIILTLGVFALPTLFGTEKIFEMQPLDILLFFTMGFVSFFLLTLFMAKKFQAGFMYICRKIEKFLLYIFAKIKKMFFKIFRRKKIKRKKPETTSL